MYYTLLNHIRNYIYEINNFLFLCFVISLNKISITSTLKTPDVFRATNLIYYEKDQIFSNRLVEEQVELPLLFFLVVIIPFAFIFYALTFIRSKRLYYLINLIICYCALMETTHVITNTLKNNYPKPRPNFYAMCDYNYFSSNYSYYSEHLTLSEVSHALIDLNNCMCIYESRLCYQCFNSIRSFPSGHTSLIFSSMSFLFIFLNCFPRIKYKKEIQAFFLFIAAWVSFTRYQDSMHHIVDILVGALIGLSVTGFASLRIFKVLQRVLS
jgi:membrane-associated phospholipid phosphatase